MCVVGGDYAVQCYITELSDQEVKTNISETADELPLAMELQQQLITPTGSEVTAVNATVTDSSSVTAKSDSIQPAALSAAPDQPDQIVDMPVSQLTSEVSSSTAASCLPPQIMPSVSSTGPLPDVSLASKSPALVFCQVTSGGQTVFVPSSGVSGMHPSSAMAASSINSVSSVPVSRSAVPLQTFSSGVQGIVTAATASPSVVVTQRPAGVRLLGQAASGIRVVAGPNNAANRANMGVVLNRGTAPHRLAVAIAPANSTLRPAGTGTVRFITIRNGTPSLAIGGVSAGSTVASPQVKLLTTAVPLSGMRPLTSGTASGTAGASSAVSSATGISAVRQQTAVNDVQAYLRRIEELKSAQPDQGAKTPVTLAAAAAVRTPLKAKTVLPSLTSAQQIVVLQSGCRPQLATQLVSS